MKGFFSRFKDKLAMDYGGRYLSVILGEVIKEDPAILAIIFPQNKTLFRNTKKLFEIELESTISSAGEDKKHRRADIAIWHEGKIVGLIEVKCEDESHDGQISNYLAFAEKNGASFTYITQYYPSKAEQQQISESQKASHLLYKNLYKQLQQNRNGSTGDQNKSITDLFCEYLKENFMVYNSIKERDLDVLKLLTLKGLNVKHRHGFNRLHSMANIRAIPGLWEQLIGNLTVLGDRFRQEFNELVSDRGLVNFRFCPYYDKKKLLKAVENAEDASFDGGQECITGGYFAIWNQGYILDKFLYSIGYSYEADLNDKKGHLEVFVELYNVKGDGPLQPEKVGIETVEEIPEENRCYEIILGLFKKYINELIKINPNMSNEFTEPLGNLL